MTTSTPRPPDGTQPPTESWLRTMLRLGRPELRSVDEARLARIWRRVDDDIDEADRARDAARPAVAPVAATDDRTAPRPSAAAGRSGWRTHVPLAAAAAVALVVGVGLGSTLSGPDDPGVTGLAEGAADPAADPSTAAPAPSVEEPTATALATYDLEPLATDDGIEVAGAAAVLVADGQGRALEVDLAGLPVPDGFHEVWLLDPDTGALASLGPVRPDGRYVVPPGTDLEALRALDVSAEPLDGDPGHSGVSLLRGEVRWVG